MKKKLDVIFSKTAYACGYGSEPYKWVAGLSKTERERVRCGGLVALLAQARDGPGGQSGTYYRIATYKRVDDKHGRYNRRVPTHLELAVIRTIRGDDK